MGAFAEALKKYKNGGAGHLINLKNPLSDFSKVPDEEPKEPKKPLNGGSLGLLGTVPPTFENIFAPNGTNTEKPEEGGFLGSLGTVPGTFENISTVPPAIEPTHRTTVDLLFNNPETGDGRTVPASTLCRRFTGTNAAMMAGVHLDYMGQWCANKNLERGYFLIWIDGALRGVHFSDIEPLITSAE